MQDKNRPSSKNSAWSPSIDTIDESPEEETFECLAQTSLNNFTSNIFNNQTALIKPKVSRSGEALKKVFSKTNVAEKENINPHQIIR